MTLSRELERYAAIATIILLVIGCYVVVRPFVTALIWGGIIAISTRPIYVRLHEILGRRRALAASLTTLGLASVLLVPIAILGFSLAGSWSVLTERIANLMSVGLAPPPSWLRELPFIGRSASSYWESVVADPERLKQDLLPLVKPAREFLVTFIASIGSGVLEFALALLISGVLYVWAEDFGTVLSQIAERLGGEMGRRQIAVVGSTIRGVFKGVIGTAAAQAGLAIVGFWLAGVPGAFLLGMGTFFLSLIPGGPIVLWLPAAIWLNANGHGGWAIFMAIWGLVVVGGSDNLIRPLLIGKGVEAPMVLIFLGVVGGLFAFGFLGLFIGPTLLAVGYNLFQDWIVSADA
jgi:predicted PurR-regulated permease PerM